MQNRTRRPIRLSGRLPSRRPLHQRIAGSPGLFQGRCDLQRAGKQQLRGLTAGPGHHRMLLGNSLPSFNAPARSRPHDEQARFRDPARLVPPPSPWKAG